MLHRNRVSGRARRRVVLAGSLLGALALSGCASVGTEPAAFADAPSVTKVKRIAAVDEVCDYDTPTGTRMKQWSCVPRGVAMVRSESSIEQMREWQRNLWNR